MSDDTINPQQALTSHDAPVRLTQEALNKVLSMMQREGKEGYGLRVGVIAGGCAGFSYDLRFQKTPYDNDLVFEQEGLKIFINPESLSLIKGLTIDYRETLKESGFKFNNPNASGTCGCGTSFS